MHDFSKTQYRPVGRCIYCGTLQDLTREHIIPAGLSGTAVLPKASCRACARVSGELERLVLRGPLWPVRVVRRLRSRRPGDAPKLFPLTFWRGEKQQVIDLPASEYPVVLQMPVLAPAAILGGEPFTSGVKVVGTNVISFGPKPDDVARRLGASRISWTETNHPVEFARMLAKIAYSYLVAELGLDSFEEVFVTDTILGRVDDAGFWVGTEDRAARKKEGLLHHMTVQYHAESKIAKAIVHLLSDSDTPSFAVYVGRLRSAPNVAAA